MCLFSDKLRTSTNQNKWRNCSVFLRIICIKRSQDIQSIWNIFWQFLWKKCLHLRCFVLLVFLNVTFYDVESEENHNKLKKWIQKRLKNPDNISAIIWSVSIIIQYSAYTTKYKKNGGNDCHHFTIKREKSTTQILFPLHYNQGHHTVH